MNRSTNKPQFIIFTLILSIAFSIMLSGFTYKADIKIGYMNPDKIFATSSEFKTAQEQHNAEREAIEKDYVEKENNLKTKVEEFQSQSLLLSEEKKQQETAKLQAMQQQLSNLYQSNFDPNQGKVAKRRAEILQPIIDKVQAIIDKIGKEEQFTMIFDSKMGGIVFAQEGIDLSDRILEELEKEK